MISVCHWRASVPKRFCSNYAQPNDARSFCTQAAEVKNVAEHATYNTTYRLPKSFMFLKLLEFANLITSATFMLALWALTRITARKVTCFGSLAKPVAHGCILGCMFRITVMTCSIALTGCLPTRSEKSLSSIPSDALERVTEKGPVKIIVHIWPSVPRLSDLVSMEIEVRFAPGVEIKPPAFGQAVGDFLIREYSEIKGVFSGSPSGSPSGSLLPGATDPSQNIRRFRYQLEPTHAGKHLIRAIGIDFVDQREGSENFGSPTTIESEPIEINVTSELGDAVPSLSSLEPMFPPRPLDNRLSWWWALLALPLAALIGFFVWRQRQETAPVAITKTLSPAEIAKAALAQLLVQNLPAQGRFQEFYLRLTGVVRQYIEGTTGVRAPEQTTEEFLRAMRSQKLFGAEQAVRLQDFLEAADMVKYAGQQPTSEQIELSIARASEFVEIRSPEIEHFAQQG